MTTDMATCDLCGKRFQLTEENILSCTSWSGNTLCPPCVIDTDAAYQSHTADRADKARLLALLEDPTYWAPSPWMTAAGSKGTTA